MLDDPSIDAVYIASPNGVHEQSIRTALEAGKSVLVEKTFCSDYNKTEELLALAAKRNMLAAECFMFLYHPQFSLVKKMLEDQDKFGRVVSVTARFGFPHLSKDNIRYKASLAGGALFDVGAYCLSAASHLIEGPSRVDWANVMHRPEFEVDTSGGAVVRLASGAPAFCDWGFGRAYRNEIEIWTENAVIAVERAFSKPADFASRVCIRHQKNNQEEIITINPTNHFICMFDHFASALAHPGERARLAADVLEQATLVRDVRMFK
jgi:NDP-hexose-3-ketoreductase